VWAVKNNIFSFQCGFLINRNTNDLLIKLNKDIYALLDNGMPTEIVFLDISKAYDSVWHNGLIWKLIKTYNIQGCILDLLVSFIRTRYTRVVLNGKYSSWKLQKVGLPQGSSLSPILYILYANDYIKLHPEYISIGTFADDTALWTLGGGQDQTLLHNKLQEELNHLIEFYDKWKLTTQTKKYKQMLIWIQKSNTKIHNKNLLYPSRFSKQKTIRKLPP